MTAIGKNRRLTGAQLGIPPWQGIPMPQAGVDPITGNAQTFAVNLGNGTPAFQYRFWEFFNAVELVGSIGGPLSALNSGAGPLQGTTVLGASPWRLPYRPSHQQYVQVACHGNTSANAYAAYIQVDSSGQFTWWNIPQTTVSISFHGWIMIDA